MPAHATEPAPPAHSRSEQTTGYPGISQQGLISLAPGAPGKFSKSLCIPEPPSSSIQLQPLVFFQLDILDFDSDIWGMVFVSARCGGIHRLGGHTGGLCQDHPSCLLCLRRPPFFLRKKKGGKEKRSLRRREGLNLVWTHAGFGGPGARRASSRLLVALSERVWGHSRV